jgi:serine/threonine protein kinase
MALTSGTQLGSYEILGSLGTGGMGEVYRARDSKLKREVAIKILPQAFSLDADRVTRFQREAEVLASLNHPHIAAIYDLAETGDSRFLVLELVGGETLAERIARGPIPINETLAIARQIAEALEAAHGKSIIHRDLKPANIKLTIDGAVKVLDFGLAKVRGMDGAAADLSNSPTMMSASIPGVIMGTAAYMPPEQAKGKDVDYTTDVWAFGCVLYEMLSGCRVFEGETLGEILGGVFKAEPDWRKLPAETPEAIRRLLRRCLQKDRNQRLQHIGDARIEIDEAISGPPTDSDPVAIQVPSRRRERLVWLSALALIILVAVVLAVVVFRPPSPVAEMRVEITTPPTTDPVSFAISPDGQKLVFVATSENRPQLWLRSLDSLAVRALPGTAGAYLPFWSPDSRSVGFFADGKLKRIDNDGGSLQTLTNNAAAGNGGAWSREGVILFVPTSASPILKISATGGETAPATRLEPPQTSHRGPHFLPDGRHFLFYAVASPEARGIYMGDIEGLETRRLLDADSAAVYAATGQLLFVRQGTLFAQNFDSKLLAPDGIPYSMAEQVALAGNNVAAISTSGTGSVVYRTGSAGGARQFIWFDRSGKETEKVGEIEIEQGNQRYSTMSPDGGRVALTRSANGNIDIWLLDLARGVRSRFTSDPAIDYGPVWSPDGKRIVFGSNRTSTFDLYQKDVNGLPGSEQLLLTTLQIKGPTDWSPDGRFLLFRSLDPKTNYDIWCLPMSGANASPIGRSHQETDGANASPTGRSHQETDGANASPTGRSHQETDGENPGPTGRSNQE